MSEALGSAVLELRTDDTHLTRGLASGERDASQSFGRMGQSAKRGLLGPLMSIAKVAGSLFAGAKIVGFFADAIQGASDLHESVTKIQVVFGKASGEVIHFGHTAAKSLGMSDNEALSAAGGFGMLFRAMGILPQKSADLSIHLVKLAGDLASFDNVSPEEALAALRSGLVGQVRPLRAFGVNINAASIQAEALATGILKPTKNLAKIKIATQTATLAQSAYTAAVAKHGKDSTQAQQALIHLEKSQVALNKETKGAVPPLTAAQKAMATYKLIMDQTKLAHGDFHRTASGLANQQRILRAQWIDMKDTIGQQLLPVVINLVGWASQAITKFQQWWPEIVKVKNYLRENADTVKLVGEAIAAMLVVVGTIKVATAIYRAVSAAIFLVRNAQLALNVAMEMNPIGVVIVALAALAAAFYLAYTRSATFRNIVDQSVHFLKTSVLPVLITIGQAIVTFVNDIRKHWGEISAILGPIVKTAIGVVKTYISTWVEQLKNIINLFGDALHGRWSKIWGDLKALVTTPLNGVRTIVTTILTNLGPLALKLATAAAQRVVDGLRTLLAKIPGWASDVKAGVKGALADAGVWLFQAGRDLVHGMINGLESMAGALTSKAKSLAMGAVHAVTGALGMNSPSRVFYDIGTMTVQGLINGIKNSSARAAQAAKVVAGNAITAAEQEIQARGSLLATDLQAAFAAKQSGVLTPAEQELANLQADHTDNQNQQSLFDAQNQFNTASAGAIDPTTGKNVVDPDAVAAAQQAIDDAQYQIKVTSLERDAQTQRTALNASQMIAQQGFDAQLTALQTYLGSAEATADGARTRITGFMEQWGISIADIGGTLGQGFVKGINDASADMIDSVDKLAKAIKHALKTGLQIKSPSRWTDKEIGVPLVQGIVRGINREGLTINKAVQAIIPDPNVILNGRMSAPAPSSGGGVQLTQVFHETPANADPAAIGAVGSWALRKVAT